MSSINVLKKVRHSQRIDRWGHTMVNYRNQLLQSADKERGGAMMKRQQYNQTWEELPQCVQRYLQRVAPEPLPNLKSLSYQQRGEVSLWDGRWDNFTSSGLITAGGLALSGIVKINSAFDYHYSDVYVEGQGHRVGYQSGISGILYAQNIEFRFTCPLYLLCHGFLAEGEDRDAKDINKIEGSNWLLDSVLTPSLLRPEAGVVTWKADQNVTDGKELPNSAMVILSEKEHEQVWATATFNEEGLMTRLEYTKWRTIPDPRPGKRPSYEMTKWECRFSEYQEQERGMWVPLHVERGMVPWGSFRGKDGDDDGFLLDYRADRVALEYEFHD